MLSNQKPLVSSTFDSLLDELFAETNSSDTIKRDEMPLKKQERIVKNRESAQASRERKKRYLAELEKSNEEMTKETRFLRSRITTLETEKLTLVSDLSSVKDQLEEIKSMLGIGAGSKEKMVAAPPVERPIMPQTKDGILCSARVQMQSDHLAQSHGPWLKSALASALPTGCSPSTEVAPVAPHHLLAPTGSSCVSSLDQNSSGLQRVFSLRLRYRRPSTVMRAASEVASEKIVITSTPIRSLKALNCPIQLSASGSVRQRTFSKVKLKANGGIRSKPRKSVNRIRNLLNSCMMRWQQMRTHRQY